MHPCKGMDLLGWLVGWLVCWILWHINLCRFFNAKSTFMQIISSIPNTLFYQFHFKQFSLVSVRSLNASTQFNCQKHFYFKLFSLVIQFSISRQFSSIWPIDRFLSGATIPDQIGPGSDGNKWMLCIPQSSSITGTSLSDCLVSYLGHTMEVVQTCSRCILQPQPTGQDLPRWIYIYVYIPPCLTLSNIR